MILLSLAFLPIILLIIFFYKRDKFEKEPIFLTFKTFLLGFLLVFPAIYFERLLSNIFQDIYFNYITLFLYIFISVSLVEEGLKFSVLFLYNFNKKDFNEPYDGIFYAVIVSLGFAAIENCMYVFSRGFLVGVLRAFTAVPAHTIFAVFMGFFLGLYKFNRNKFFIILSFILPIILHTIYDFIAMNRWNLGLIYLEVFVFLFSFISLLFMGYMLRRSPFKDKILILKTKD